MTRPEPRCLVTTATGQTPPFTLGDRSNPPGTTRWCAGWALEERGEVGGQMGTITHRGGKNKEALSHLCSETPTNPQPVPAPPYLYCFFASSFVRLRRYGSSLAAGGTAIYQIHWKSAVSPHCPPSASLGSQRSAFTTGLVFI